MTQGPLRETRHPRQNRAEIEPAAGMKSTWDRRIERATELMSAYPFAAESLRFYAQVAMLQHLLGVEVEHAPANFFLTQSDSSKPARLQPSAFPLRFSDFIKKVSEIAPAPLAHGAEKLLQEDPATRTNLLKDFWQFPVTAEDETQSNDTLTAARYLAWLFLQPFAEYQARHQKSAGANESARRCPLCGSAPIVGVLRPEGDGAKKSLICMLCAHEWAFRRIYCPACGEERDSQLAFYSAPEIAHIRVDVCDSCHTYLKSVDLTKTGLAVPVVDELAALPLDLWAREHGYHKLQMNMVGM